MDRVDYGADRRPEEQPTSGLSALLAVLGELRLIRHAVDAAIRASRYNRGGYDGPFSSAEQYDVPTANPILVFEGVEEPRALLFTWDGGGNAGDLVFISGDRGQMRGGFPLAINAAGVFRIIAREHERLYAQTVRVAGGGDQRIVMREALT